MESFRDSLLGLANDNALSRENLAFAAARAALAEAMGECEVFAATTGLSGASFAEAKLRRRIGAILDTLSAGT